MAADAGPLIQKAVSQLRAMGILRSDFLESAVREIPRTGFFADSVEVEHLYDLGRGIPVKEGLQGSMLSSGTCLQFVVQMLEMAHLAPGQTVLEIGTGPAFSTALTARLVGNAGYVVSIEPEQDIADQARRTLQAHGLGGVEVFCGDGFAEPPGHGQFDRILVAVAAPEIAPAWLDRLADGGVIVAVIRGPIGAFLLRGKKRDGALDVDIFIRFGFWLSLRSPMAKDAAWFPPHGEPHVVDRFRSSREWRQWFETLSTAYRQQKELPMPLPLLNAHGLHMPDEHPFWTIACLCGFPWRAMTTCTDRKDWIELVMVSSQTAARYRRKAPTKIEVLGGESIYREILQVMDLWGSLQLGTESLRLAGNVRRHDDRLPAESLKTGQWLRRGQYTDLHLEARPREAEPGNAG